MAYDGLTMAVLKNELEAEITGTRVDKIYQPAKKTVLLHLRTRERTLRLLLSAEADSARIHLTDAKFKNPVRPPVFCMVLRKHLDGGFLTAVTQQDMERLMAFEFLVKDTTGTPKKMLLHCEIMGKHSNIILADAETETIVDGIKRYSREVSRFREILPGRPYSPPPIQEKADPRGLDEDEFLRLLLDSPLGEPIGKVLLVKLQGLSPQTCREIIARAGLKSDAVLDECGEFEFSKLWQSLQAILGVLKGEAQPTLFLGKQGGYEALAPMDLDEYLDREKKVFPSMNEAVDAFYSAAEYWKRFQALKQRLSTLVDRCTRKCEKKLELMSENLEKEPEAGDYRLMGEAVTANIYRLKRGQKELEAFDYEGNCLIVPLNPALTPAENAQKYFSKYRKSTTKKIKVEERAAAARSELEYLGSVEESLSHAEKIEDLQEILEELKAQKYIREPQAKTRTPVQANYLTFQSSDGFKIFVGKNNRQNDVLTLKIARDEDLWFHAKGFPGAHVIVKCDTDKVPENTIDEAAHLAASFSRGRHSGNVPVDFTRKKHVRKPKGARPGLVIYDNQKTVFVTPDADIINALKQT